MNEVKLSDGSQVTITHRNINGSDVTTVKRTTHGGRRGGEAHIEGDLGQEDRAIAALGRLRRNPDYYQPRKLDLRQIEVSTLRGLFTAFEAATGERLRLVTFGEDYSAGDWWPDEFSSGLWRLCNLPDWLLDDEKVRLDELRLTGWSDAWVAFLAEYDAGYGLGLWWVPRDPSDHHPIHPMHDE